MNKRELQIEAKRLIKKSPKEAMAICKKLWVDFPQDSPDKFNLYDALLTLDATKKNYEVDFNFIYDVANMFSEKEQISNAFGWFVFFKYIKGRSISDIIQNENAVSRLIELVPQKNLSIDDRYPCPVTICLLGLVKAYAKGLFNARKVNEWLEKLNPEYLSRKENIIPTKDKGDIKDSSDLEKYYAWKTKALIKLERYEDCEELCKKALDDLKGFHYDNSLWLKMRIAICEEHLGNIENSEQLFHQLIATKAGSDKWFIYKEIAVLYFEQGGYENAWRYAVDAAFYGNDPEYMIGLYLLQARILFKLERVEEGKTLAQLIAAVLNEKGWNNREEYNRIFNFYNIDIANVKSVRELYKVAKKFWQSERYKGLNIESGRIIFIHPKGKQGKIKMEDGKVIDFHKRNFQKRQRNLVELKDSKVTFVKMTSFNGKIVAENIVILEKVETLPNYELVGQLFKGTIKNIVSFGIFVKLDGHSDGLIHKNELPNKIKESFEESFQLGQQVDVKVIKVTEKGLQLKLQT